MKNRIIVATLILFLQSLSPAMALDKKEVFLDKLQLASKKVETLSLDFVQEKEMALFAEPLRFTGHLDMRRPDAMRWQFYTPLPSALILDGSAGLRCENGEQQPFTLAADPVMRIVAEQLWSWVGGDYKALAKQYQLTLVGDRTLVITFAKDKPIANYLQEVRLHFTADFSPLGVDIIESSGDTTKIYFSPSPKKISAKTFSSCASDE